MLLISYARLMLLIIIQFVQTELIAVLHCIRIITVCHMVKCYENAKHFDEHANNDTSPRGEFNQISNRKKVKDMLQQMRN
jgi:hypothetical protein